MTTYPQTQYYHLIYILPSWGFLLISPTCDLVFIKGKHGGGGRNFSNAQVCFVILELLNSGRGGTIKEVRYHLRQGWYNIEVAWG